jgi:dTDP-4-dehydrorhamnose 3,5-epimerase
MQCEGLGIEGALLFRPNRHEDARGFFAEAYNRRVMSEYGVDDVFVQDNHSLSRQTGTIRGLHFQIAPHAIAKLIWVVRGAIVDVILDIRHGSPTFGEHRKVELTAADGAQLYVPVGTAHGFCTTEPDTEVIYKVTDHWSVEVDKGIAWDDPALGIDWPVRGDEAILSDKDRLHPTLADSPRYFDMETM